MKNIKLLIIILACSTPCFSNNIQVNNVSLLGQNTTSDFSMVKFDISWDNSWRTSTFESNWDAAWVFVKFRKKTTLIWKHATLNSTGQVAPAGSTVTVSNILTPFDGKGAFIYKSANGIGSNNFTGVQLRWNYGFDGLSDFDSVEVCVFAIEMVYIPQGIFPLGDGSNTALNGQFESGTSNFPMNIGSEAALTLGGTNAGSLGNHARTGQSTLDDFIGGSGLGQTLPAAFPKGFNAFYIMKYEISQEQYVEFLNKLTWVQQTARTAVAPNAAAGTYALSNTNRNGIVVKQPGVMLISNAIYACNLDGDAIYNEANDGQNIACNYLKPQDVLAYLDWSGLRPITEMEYEKACRGIGMGIAVPDEFAWGGNIVSGSTSITNPGLNNESANTGGANCAFNNAAGVQGPVRVGSFAGVTNRQNSGGSYFGVMELSGNLAEFTVSVGGPNGRAFTGNLGNGFLDINGEANETTWPNPTVTNGFIYRGGDWFNGITLLRVSDRTNPSAYFNGTRRNDCGGRGGHQAP